MATSDDRRLIDNASSKTVDNFYGNKGGADVQIPLATAASVLAGVIFGSTNMVFKDRPMIASDAELDAVSTSGTFRVKGYTSEKGYPSDCILCSIRTNTCDSTIQITFNYRAVVYVRVNWYGNWSAWRCVTLT